MTKAVRAHLRSVPTEQPTEEDLILDAQAGSRDAFSRLFRSHARYIAGVAYRVLGSSDEVDDVVQDTFIAAHRSLASLNEAGAFRRWLVTIAIRQVNKRLRSRSKLPYVPFDCDVEDGAATDSRASELVDELYEILRDMPPALRVPWVLARIEGHKLEDVASECEISLATAKRKIALADQRLRRRLDDG